MAVTIPKGFVYYRMGTRLSSPGYRLPFAMVIQQTAKANKIQGSSMRFLRRGFASSFTFSILTSSDTWVMVSTRSITKVSVRLTSLSRILHLTASTRTVSAEPRVSRLSKMTKVVSLFETSTSTEDPDERISRSEETRDESPE